ncbi:MAG: hypothetical protein J6V42_03755 [Clostridia bacterium]|nr:hypothetical protein [Clostridia bacterium]
MPFLGLLFLILIVAFFPYIKRAYFRYRFLNRLKTECAKRRYRVENIGGIASYFKNFSRGFDVLVDTGKTVHAIKFWNETYKNTNTIFMPNGVVYKRRKVVDVFGEGGKRTHAVLESSDGRLALKDPKIPASRTLSKYFVLDSASSFYQFIGTSTEKVKAGDMLYGMRVSSAAYVLKTISKS